MKSRLECVREYVNGIFDRMEDAEAKRAAYVHSYGVSQCCALLAPKRGLDLELSPPVGLLQDVYSYKTGCTALHSHNGAEMVRVDCDPVCLSLAVADFDHDGTMDIAATSNAANSGGKPDIPDLVILPGDGDGTFSLPLTYDLTPSSGHQYNPGMLCYLPVLCFLLCATFAAEARTGGQRRATASALGRSYLCAALLTELNTLLVQMAALRAGALFLRSLFLLSLSCFFCLDLLQLGLCLCQTGLHRSEFAFQFGVLPTASRQGLLAYLSVDLSLLLA